MQVYDGALVGTRDFLLVFHIREEIFLERLVSLSIFLRLEGLGPGVEMDEVM